MTRVSYLINKFANRYYNIGIVLLNFQTLVYML